MGHSDLLTSQPFGDLRQTVFKAQALRLENPQSHTETTIPPGDSCVRTVLAPSLELLLDHTNAQDFLEAGENHVLC